MVFETLAVHDSLKAVMKVILVRIDLGYWEKSSASLCSMIFHLYLKTFQD